MDKKAAQTAKAALRCRVLARQYGSHLQGEVVEVDEIELGRVGSAVLVTLEEEAARRRVTEERPALARDLDFDERREGERAWAALARKSRAIVAEHQAKAASQMAKVAGAAAQE